jgi:hypothetical protein
MAEIKVSKREVKRVQKIISGELSQIEKDEVLAHLVVGTFEMSRLVKQLSEKIEKSTEVSLSKTEKRSIENMVSLGPSWLNFTRKVKTKG